MPDLTQDEEACLLIANEGQWMAPIGRWKEPIENLALKGLLFRKDASNYGITGEGRIIVGQLDRQFDDQLKSLVQKSNQIGAVHTYARAFITPAVQLLVQMTSETIKITGETPEEATARWCQVIREEALKLLVR